MIISTLSPTKSRFHDLPGTCANCSKEVFESNNLLSDCYNIWAGACPHCKAINLLSMNHGLRGYSSSQMWLVLPTDEEVAANESLPRDCPTQGSKGPATAHGTPAGELYHILKEEKL
jgi:hypothetical protein